MEYLKKQKNPPIGWDQLWILNDGITLASDYEEFNNAPLPGARKTILDILIAEQNGLCFYCQNDNVSSFTIEHLIPQSNNPELSLNYHNLTAVCLTCNNNRSDDPIPFLTFYKGTNTINVLNGSFDSFFSGYAVGHIAPNQKLKSSSYNSSNSLSKYKMIEAYIEAVGLNRNDLTESRKMCYLKEVGTDRPITTNRKMIKRYLEDKFSNLLKGPPVRFRLFLLLVLASKIQKL